MSRKQQIDAFVQGLIPLLGEPQPYSPRPFWFADLFRAVQREFGVKAASTVRVAITWH
jgi:hypothetical protein